LAQALQVTEGEEVSVFGCRFPAAATFPETLLTLASAHTDGTLVVGEPLLRRAGADRRRSGGVEFLLLKLPPGTTGEEIEALTGRLVDRLGRAAVLGVSDLAPLFEQGLERLGSLYFWSAVVIVFMCAFGIAYGVEDYARSRVAETAIMRTFGAGLGRVLGIVTFRLALAGLAAGVLGVLWSRLLGSLSSALAGAGAREMIELATPATVPWSFLLVGPILVLTYGLSTFVVTMQATPALVLRGKAAGFLVPAERKGEALLSLAIALVVTLVAVPLLGRLYLGGGFAQGAVMWLILIACLVLLGAVALAMWMLGNLGQVAPVALRWPLTYLRLGRSRVVAAMTAVAVALSVGTGALILERPFSHELELSIARQIPATILAIYPAGAVTSEQESAVVARLQEHRDVEVSPGGAVLARLHEVNGQPVSKSGGMLVAIKLVDPARAHLYNSTLTLDLVNRAAPGEIPCSVWEEFADRLGIGPGDSLVVGVPVGARAGSSGRMTLRVVSVDPFMGVRLGIMAAITVPHGAIGFEYGVMAVRCDPTRSAALRRELARMLEAVSPGGPTGPAGVRVYDLGAILLLLRAAVGELAFLWWLTAGFSLLVSLAVYFSSSSIARIRRASELALFRALGASSWQLQVGPLVEALTQGVVCGLAAGGLAQFLFLKAAGFIFNERLPFDYGILGWSLALSLVLALVTGYWSFGRAAAETPMHILRNE
ncbi:MAG: FtsX-like permease family protein, partial [Bacillota bacterium]